MNRLPLSRFSDEGVNSAADWTIARLSHDLLPSLPFFRCLCLLKCESVS